MELDLGHSGGRETFSFKEEFPVRGPEEEDVPCRASVTVESTRTGSSYLLEGEIEAAVRLECSRCLKAFDFKIITEFSLVLQRGRGMPDTIEEEDFILLSEAQEYDFDIFPVVREAILIEMPIKYLCAESCMGICPGCGADLNEGACGCGEETGDPRWDSLKKLLKEEEEK